MRTWTWEWEYEKRGLNHFFDRMALVLDDCLQQAGQLWPGPRVASAALAVGIIYVDGGLVATWAAKRRGEIGPFGQVDPALLGE